MAGAKPVATPMCPHTHFTLHSGKSVKDTNQYRSAVGSIQYLSLIRPYISFPINRLSQYMHRSTIEHCMLLKDSYATYPRRRTMAYTSAPLTLPHSILT